MNYGAIDFYPTKLSSFVLDIPLQEGKHKWVSLHWLPETSLQDHWQYQYWVNQGLIRLSRGSFNSMDLVIEDMFNLQKKYDFAEVSVDSYNASIWRYLEHHKFRMIEQSLTYATLSAPTRAFLFMRDELLRENPILSWMATNTRFVERGLGVVKPSRANTNPIGGIVAGIMALDRALRETLMKDIEFFNG